MEMSSSIPAVPEFMVDIPRLGSMGENFGHWQHKLRCKVRDLIGSLDCLDTEFPPIDLRTDRLAYSMVFWSIDEQLQKFLDPKSSACKAYKTMHRLFDPPSRDPQLAVLREILMTRHHFDKPVSEHLNFVRARVELLDRQGFSWTKDSILSHLLQVGLPSYQTHNGTYSYENVNAIMRNCMRSKPCCPSAPQIEKIILAEAKFLTAPCVDFVQNPMSNVPPVGGLSFAQLPEDILNQVIAYVRELSHSESDDIAQRKWLRLTKGRAHLLIHWVYPPKETPIFNSLQSLASVNRSLNRLCQPWLWKCLTFPNLMPCYISFWTNDLLPKYGVLVRSLALELSEEWFNAPFQDACFTSLDNTVAVTSDYWSPFNPDFSRDKPRSLSPQSVTQILVQCPAITKLELQCPIRAVRAEEGQVADALSQRLISLLSHLGGLQHLNIKAFGHNQVRDECMNRILPSLPLLESLSLSHVRSSSVEEATLFGKNLSDLRHLSFLSFTRCLFKDETWFSYPAPCKLTGLVLLTRNSTTILADAHRIISRFAPNLTKLTIGLHSHFPDPGDTVPEEIQDIHSFPLEERFNLPALTDLTIKNFLTLDLLASVQDCKNVQRFGCHNLPSYGWSALVKLIREGTWPQLKWLDMRGQAADWLFEPTGLEAVSVISAQEQLKKLCGSAGITLVLSSEDN